MSIIYKRETCLRKDLFDSFIRMFVEAGWEVLEDNGTEKDYRIVIHSKGSNGRSPMYLAFYPYSGQDALGKPGYDIRKSNSTDGLFKWIREWDYENKKEISIYGNWNRLNFFYRSPKLTYGGELTLSQDLEMEYYCYADLDRVVFIAIPNETILKQQKPGQAVQPIVHFFGIPEETYVEEKNEPSYSCAIHASSSTSYSGMDYAFLTCNTPKRLLDNFAYQNKFTYLTCYPAPAEGGSNNGTIMLWDLYIAEENVGLRAKLGFLQCFKPNGKIIADGRSGDTIEIETENGIEVYLPFWTNYFSYGSESSSKTTSSFGSEISYLAIRIR
ncbi:hypothetical protein [Bacillus toyonensis]|uniref:hypothetical protein n=1 Tax=Bacillus toyonensis TaxID=155322 RepID=UPI0015964234|nr:hypothetical protein [Bacillus toyonensis]